MKVQTVKNYITTRNYQADKTNPQQMPSQQSFGKVIFDERGMERMGEGLRNTIKKMFTEIKTLLGKEILESTEHDVLLQPFQENRHGGITVIKKYFSGNMHQAPFHRGEPDFSSSEIATFIKDTYREATTFPKEDRFDYLWKIEKPLPEEELQRRFDVAA